MDAVFSTLLRRLRTVSPWTDIDTHVLSDEQLRPAVPPADEEDGAFASRRASAVTYMPDRWFGACGRVGACEQGRGLHVLKGGGERAFALLKQGARSPALGLRKRAYGAEAKIARSCLHSCPHFHSCQR